MKFLPTLLLPILVFTACKKDEEPSLVGCRVKHVKVTVNDSLTPTVTDYQLIYNDDGKVQQVTEVIASQSGKSNLTKVFKYTGSTIEILALSNRKVIGKDSLVLDAQGQVSKILRTMSDGKLNPSWNEYIYDSKGQMILIKSHSGPNTSVDSVFWENGDLVRQGAYYTFTYSYYDTAYNIGVIKAPLEELLMYGRGITKVNRLGKTRYFTVYNNIVYTRSYSLDTDGKIVEMVSNDQAGRSTTWKIEYDCR